MNTRSGSFLIVCLSLMGLMIILTFAVLHDLRTQVDTSTGNQRYLLAEGAARSGLDHALEQIVLDYNQTTMTVRSAAGPVTLPAFTYLDGPYRAPFVSINNPNSMVTWLEGNSPTDDDDVRFEDWVMRPWQWWWSENGWFGNQLYDGRGRYYEPGYYNLNPSPAGSDIPVHPVPFLDLNAALPERSQAMFYDEQFRRIPPSGNPRIDRQNARYRLRYAVGVEDLSGHILINPLPDMHMISGAGFPPVDYRTPSAANPWMATAINTLANYGGVCGGGEFGSQLENVFEGRGYYTNIDLDHTATGINGPASARPWPKTFPLMYRSQPNPLLGQGGDCWSSWVYGNGNLTNNLYYSQFGSPRGLAQGGEILPPSCGGGGGNFWPYYVDGGPGVIMHCLMGPQMSFDNVAYAASGESAHLTDSEFLKYAMTPFGRRLSTSGYVPYGANRWYQGRVDTPFYMNLMTTPAPLIDSMLYAYVQPWIKTYAFYALNWYQVTPPDPATGWPSASILLRTDAIDGSKPANQAYGYSRDLMVSTTAPPAFAQWAPPTRQDGNPPGATTPPGAAGQVISPDYYALDPRLTDPNVVPAGSGLPVKIYPGPFMNGNAANPGQGGDDLGLNMDEVAAFGQPGNINGPCMSFGFDPYTWPNYSWNHGYLLTYAVNQPTQTWGFFYSNENNNNKPPSTVTGAAITDALNWATLPTDGSVTPPPGWTDGGPNPGANYMEKAPNPNSLVKSHLNSYYFDLIAAMAQAIAVFRSEYLQYSNVFFSQDGNPWIGKIFNTGQDPQPQAYQTLRDLDRLFLAELGESLDHPGTGAPASLGLTAFQPSNVGHGLTAPFVPYVAKNNIWSLAQNHLLGTNVTANGASVASLTDAQRAHVMELLLNDFRMSFFGCSPAYSDVASATQEFRPLDFLGDGMAYCSCYAGSDNDPIYPLPCAPPGTKPPTYFTIAGAFFIGKSHYYRVFSRGEVWDNLLNHKLDEATLDSALSVDPEGDDPTQTQFLFQRWMANRYQGMLPAIKR